MATKQEYFAHPAKSRSSLYDFEIAPAYYKYYKDHPEDRPDPSVDMEIGSVLHYLVNEPENVSKYVFVLKEYERPHVKSDYRNTENREWKNSLLAAAAAAGQEVISSDDYQIAEDMYDALTRDEEVRDLLFNKELESEKMTVWEVDGIQYKMKTDKEHDLYMLDLKKMRDASYRAAEKAIFSYGYDLQGGMYSDGGRIVAASEFFKPYYIVCIEDTPPYLTSVHLLTDEVLQHGADRYRRLGKQMAVCERTGIWPGYSFGRSVPNNIVLPNYLKSNE